MYNNYLISLVGDFMDYILIGKYTSTHGLKGEIKILPFIEEASKIIIQNTIIYIGESKKAFKVNSSRIHQKYVMVILDTLDTIDSVMPYKNSNIYIRKEDIKIDLITDIIGYKVYNKGIYIGNVEELLKGVKYNMIVVGTSRIIIPYIDTFVLNIDKQEKIIKTDFML
jgi:16S rRNA processing protein RimM